MKSLHKTMTALSLLTMIGCGNAGKHQEESAPAKDSVSAAPAAEHKQEATPLDSAAQAKAWIDYATPGQMHKVLAAFDGKWEGEMSSYMAPDAPPMVSKVSAEHKSILGGRYQEALYKGKMMDMDFEGRGMTAYDNARKKFISTWIDNMGTGVMVMEGTYDEAGKTMNLSGKMIDPSSGKELDMREVLKLVDDKHQVMEMYCTRDGKEEKAMEIRLTKK